MKKINNKKIKKFIFIILIKILKLTKIILKKKKEIVK